MWRRSAIPCGLQATISKRRFVTAGLLCAGLAGCGGQPGDVSEELAGLSSQLEAINQRLDKLEEAMGEE